LVAASLSLLSWMICLLPEKAVVAGACTLGLLWWHVVRYRRSTIEENLARAFPELGRAERRALGIGASIHLVRTLLEFLRIPRYASRGFEGVRIEGLEHLDAAKRRGKGVLCVTAHLGSFELAIAATAARVRPVSAVVKAFPRGVDAFIARHRMSRGLTLISAASALRPVMQTLDRNEPIVFVLDQNATRRIGVFVDFFGTPACTMSALAIIALRTGAPVIGATIHREGDGTHVVRIHPEIPLEEKATRKDTIAHMTARYTLFIEEAIRAHPEQWLWTHKRWRTRPRPDESPSPHLKATVGAVDG
jgi:Kdo2-lipid IVA lauroyltransferase/acyltransferase